MDDFARRVQHTSQMTNDKQLGKATIGQRDPHEHKNASEML
jgi:hypothetical protein